MSGGFGFIKMDSPFIRFLSFVADLMILNLLTVLCCIPVVTAGASFAAMHYVLTKMVRNEEGYIVKSFFHAFKQNLLQGIFIWIGMIGVGALLWADYMILLTNGSTTTGWPAIILYAIAIFVLMTALYIFPVLSRYHNTIRGIIKVAVSMMIVGMGYLRTIANVLLFMVPFAVVWFMGMDAMPFLIVFCFTLPGYFRAVLYNGLFKKYEEAVEDTTEQTEESTEVSTEENA